MKRIIVAASVLYLVYLAGWLFFTTAGRADAQVYWNSLLRESTGQLSVHDGGDRNKAIASAAGTVVVSGAPSSLVTAVITAAGTASLTCYDNASAASGTVIAVTPATTSVGQIYSFNMPAANGITCSDPTSGPGVTLSYN